MAPPLNGASRPRSRDAVTSSFLLDNLHCPSCVSTIREVLQEACVDHIRWVSPNIVTSVVTVEHDSEASLDVMAAALTDAGFDICAVTTSTSGNTALRFDGAEDAFGAGDSGVPQTAVASSSSTGTPLHSMAAADKGGDSIDTAKQSAGMHEAGTMPVPPSSSASASASGWGFSPLARWMSGGGTRQDRRTTAHSERIRQAHLDNCEQCRLQNSSQAAPNIEKQLTTLSHVEELDAGASKSPLSEDSKAVSRPAQQSKKPSIGVGMTEKSFVTVEHEDAPAERPTWKASIAVGGMTCAVCVNAITDDLKRRDWISKVHVNLISNSATVEFDDKDKAAKIVEAIEDLGYDATIDSITAVEAPRPQGEAAPEPSRKRTVEILIQGLYCEHCPDRVISSLAGFRRASLEVITKPTPQRPILSISYMPDAPVFTIRHILAAIEASDAALTASIYHPPTLEERSKMIRAKHQRKILYRVASAGIVCIPTFIIGIVYMSLLPRTNAGRMFITAPWTSGISRAQIALFVLATPVYFFGADIFHVRAFKEIRTLWRRGSRTPVLQRFYRFGSMNTLMSLGTTIAYVSSVSQMIAAAAYQETEVSDSNFYFDSVVFLTFFLLVGRLIEAYSKSRTGDAVEMLGRLRPTTAILVEGGSTTATTVHADKETVADAVSRRPSSPLSSTSSPPPRLSLPPTPPPGNVSGIEVKADMLDFGDVVRVLHGSSPPADGVVVQGQTNFDESSLTGESRLVAKTVGDAVFSGTVNKDAPVLVRITGTSGTSMLDQIVAVVREGQTKRAPMEQIADLLTTYFVPVVTLVAILTFVIWLSLGLSGSIPGHFLDTSSGGWVAFSLQFAVAVFVVACPCGLGLAAPTAIFVAGGMAAKYGILAKGGGEAFEKASRIDCVVFDKTGTLTMGGEPTVTDSAMFSDLPDEDDADTTTAGKNKQQHDKQRETDLLFALKAVEESSGHPVAKAIVSFCSSRLAGASGGGSADDLQEIAGRGMQAVYHGSAAVTGAGAGVSFEMIVGNEAMMSGFSVAISAGTRSLLQKWKTEAKSIALVAVRPTSDSSSGSGTADKQRPWTLAAALSIADPVRPEAAPILAALQANGILVYMLSGDNAITARAVARELGIPADQVIAEVLPTEKAAKIKALQASLPARSSRLGRPVKKVGDGVFGATAAAVALTATATATSDTDTETAPLPPPSQRAMVAMVGDGINDSPALTQADVGIAVGSGSDVAISSADFVLVQSNLQAVVTLLELSKAVFRRIMFNFGWALVYNILAVPIAAGALYPIRTASTTHVRLDPVWASLAMALSSISVVMSSLLLRSHLPGVGFRPTTVRVPPQAPPIVK